jgi:hypothetical protein
MLGTQKYSVHQLYRQREKKSSGNLIIYFCRTCDFEHWAYDVIPKLKCRCGYYAEHEEREE